MKDAKIKKRCKYAYALAVRTGTAEGTHAPASDYKREQARSAAQWLDEVSNEYEQGSDSNSEHIRPSEHRL